MDRFRSALLIGLGEPGSTPALKAWKRVVDNDPQVRPLVQCCCLTGTGELIEAHSDTPLVALPGLQPDLAALQANFAAVADADEAIQAALETLLGASRDYNARVALEDRGTRIDGGLAVYVFAALADPIGGAALLPVLGSLRRAVRRVARGIPVTPEIVALLPLHGAPKADYARAYAAAAELDWAAENPSAVLAEDAVLADMIYLIGQQNEAGFQLESPEAVSDVAAEVISAILERRLLVDRSFEVTLFGHREGKRTRYSSFGLGKLTFPAADFRRIVGALLETRLCESIGLSAGRLWDAELLSAETNRFADAAKLEELMVAMGRNVDGSPAWPGFATPLRLDERTFVDDAAGSVRESAAEFERAALPGLIQGLGRRSVELENTVMTVWRQHVASLCDDATLGVTYARAFAASFLAEGSSFSRGASVTSTRSFPTLEALAKRPFDAIAGVDRVLPDRLGRDLAAKHEALQALETSLDTTPPVAGGPADPRAARKSALDTEIETLAASHAAAVTRVTEFDLVLQDATHRRALLARHDSNQASEKDTIESAQSADQAFQAAARQLDSVVEARDETFKRWFVVQPILGLIAAVVMVALSVYLGAPFETIWSFALRASVVSSLGYFGWRIVLFRVVHEQVRIAERHREHAVVSKKDALWAINTWHANRLADEFDRALWSTSYSLIEKLRTRISENKARLDDFGDRIDQAYRAASEVLATHDMVDSVVVRPMFKRSAAMELIAARKERIELELAQSASRIRPSAHFEAYLEHGKPVHLRAAAEDCLQQVCGPLLELPACDVVVQQPEDLPLKKLADRLQVLSSMSKALIQLDVEKGEDASDQLYYLGGADADDVLVRELSALVGMTVSLFPARDRQALTFCKFKVGFPAFQVSALRVGRDALEAFADQRAFYTMPDLTVPDLVPSLHTIGSDDDPVRRLLYLGAVLGVVVSTDGGYTLDGEELGASMEDSARTLRKLTARALRGRLEEAVTAELAKPDAVDRLLTRLSRGVADPVDAAILKREIDGFSTLS